MASGQQREPPARASSWNLERLVAWMAVPRSKRPGSNPPGIRETLGISEEIGALSRGEPTQALQLSQQLVELTRRGDSGARAIARRCRGHMFRRLGRHRQAIRDYTYAMGELDRAGMKLEAARTGIGMVGALGYMGRASDALRLAARARRVFVTHGEHGRAARLDVNVGVILRRSGRPREALDAYRRAEDTFAQQQATADLALVRFNQANVLVTLDRYDEALGLYRSSADTWTSLGATATACRCHLAIGSVLFRLGRLDQALSLFETVTDQSKRLDDPVLTATAALDQARAEILVDRVESAEARLETAIASFQSLSILGDLAESLGLRGSLRMKAGLLEDSLSDWRRAGDLYRGARDRRGAAWADVSRALVLMALGRTTQGRSLARVALRALQRHGPRMAEIEARLLLAEQVIATRPGRAARHLARVANGLRSIREPWIEYRLRIAQARLALRVRDTKRARTALERAYRIARDLRSFMPLEILRAQWLGRRDELFRLALDSGFGSDRQLAWKFRWSERARLSTGMFEPLGRRSPVNGSDRDRIVFEQAREELYWLDARERSRRFANSEPASEPAGGLATWRRKRASTLSRLERFGRRLEVRAAREGSPDQDPDPAAIQASLSGDEALIEFFVGDQFLMTFMVTRNSMDVWTSSERVDEWRQVAFRLRQAWDRYRLGAGFVRRHGEALAGTTRQLLETLGGALVRPIREILPHKIQKLVICPHSWVRSVPFHALMDDDWMVRYAPSGMSLITDEPPSKRTTRRVLVIGVSSEDAPGAEREARVVSRHYPGSTVLLGADATPARVRAHWPDADVIHIAAHGSIQGADPRLSGIHLTGGTWTVHDLRTVRTRASLVVLSSCQSGETVLWGTDYQVGLLPALLEGRSRTAVASLWSADDTTTEILMTAFHHELSLGRTAGEALRSARHVIRRVKPDPYYWAPFVTYGQE